MLEWRINVRIMSSCHHKSALAAAFLMQLTRFYGFALSYQYVTFYFLRIISWKSSDPRPTARFCQASNQKELFWLANCFFLPRTLPQVPRVGVLRVRGRKPAHSWMLNQSLTRAVQLLSVSCCWIAAAYVCWHKDLYKQIVLSERVTFYRINHKLRTTFKSEIIDRLLLPFRNNQDYTKRRLINYIRLIYMRTFVPVLVYSSLCDMLESITSRFKHTCIHAYTVRRQSMD